MKNRSIALAVGASLAVVGLGSASASSAAEPAAAPAPVAAPTYKIVKLGVLPGDELSIPAAINVHGDVVGYSGGFTMPPMPFRYTDATKKIKPIPLPPGYTSGHALDLNDAGFVTGEVQTSPQPNDAIRWRPNGKFVLLGSLGGPDDASGGTGINNSNAVAGTSSVDSGEFEALEAFRYTDAKGMVSVTPGARPGQGDDINGTGEISGSVEFHAVRITSDGIEDISGSLLGITTGTALNNGGQVAITQEVHDANDVWRWTPGVGLEDLEIDSSDERVRANGINNDGDVVGLGRPVGSDNIRAGFLYRDGLGSVDLNDLLAGRGAKTWFIAEAWDINDEGQIVAEALNLKTFQTMAVRLDPVR